MSVLLLTIGFVVAALVARHNDVRLVASTRELRQSLALQEQVRTLVAPLLFAEAATAPRAPGAEAIPATAAAFRALDDVPRELERTRALVGAEPLAQANFERLASLIEARLAQWRALAAAGDAAARRRAWDALLADSGRRLGRTLEASAAAMILDEQDRLAAYQEQLAIDAAFGRSWLVFFVAVTGAFVLLVLVLALRMRRLQRFARMCAWSRTIEFEGEWISFEEYLERRFGVATSHGISPLEAEKMRAAAPPPVAPEPART